MMVAWKLPICFGIAREHPSAQCPATHQELEAWEQFNPTKVGMGMLKDCYKWEMLLGIEMITENERYNEIQKWIAHG